MNNENISIYYEDSEGICVFDRETRIGVSIDQYEENDYFAEIIPVYFENDDDNEVIEISSNLRNRLTFTREGFKSFEKEVCELYDADYNDSFRTDDGFVCELPKSFWEYGMSNLECSQRLELASEILSECMGALKESRIDLIEEMAEDVADEWNLIVVDDAEIDSEAFASDVRDAVEKDFLTFNDIKDFTYVDIQMHLATTYCIKHNFDTSYDVKMQLVSDLGIELGSNKEQNLEELLLPSLPASIREDICGFSEDDIIMEDVNNIPIDLNVQSHMVSQVVAFWGE